MNTFIFFDHGGTLAHAETRRTFIRGTADEAIATLHDGVLVTLEALHQQGVQMGIISNTNCDHDKYVKALEKTGLNKYFSCVLLVKCACAHSKPRGTLFRDGLEYAKSQGCDRVFYVGNDYIDDIMGAAPYMYTVLCCFGDEKYSKLSWLNVHHHKINKFNQLLNVV